MKTSINLTQLAYETMKDRGLEPDFSKEEMFQVSHITRAAAPSQEHVDLRSFAWCSIDNDDSRDLDQLTYAEMDSYRQVTLWVAVADVDSLVKKGSPIDQRAEINTTSVYTPTKIFPMLPEQLSTNLTSLNENEDRLAIVVKMLITENGDLENPSIFQAVVRNHAKLAYSQVGPWLNNESGIPQKIKEASGVESSLVAQHQIAQLLRKNRHIAGSLTLMSPKAEVRIAKDDEFVIQLQPHNLAHQLIEECMIAANRVMAQSCKEFNIASLRRVVRIPKQWDRIVDIAHSLGYTLPKQPDSQALESFLIQRQQADPDSFPDISLTIIKLLGRGEYIVENDKNNPVGHFALAIPHYTHSTAPNRRFPDLIAQRQYKAFLQRISFPYSIEELRRLAEHCSLQEDAAMKVERHMNKSAAAMLLAPEIGAIFKGIITGVGDKGVWVRIFQPAVDGKVINPSNKLRVGDKVSVKLVSVDIRRGFIDFTYLSNHT